MGTFKKTFIAGAIVLTLFAAPVQPARAGFGGGGGFTSFLVTVGIAVALTAIGQPQMAFSLESFLASPGAIIEQVATSFAENLVNPSVWISNLTSETAFSSIMTNVVLGIGQNIASCVVGVSNCGSGSVSAPSGGLNLYVVTDSLSQLVAGEGARLTGSVTNNGNTAINGSFTNRFQIFADSVILENSADLAPSPLYASIADGLPAGASVNIETTWQIPASFTPGQYFLRLCANVSETVVESNGGNNCGDVRAFTILPAGSVPSARANTSPQVAAGALPWGRGIPSVALSAQAAGAGGAGDLVSGLPTIVPIPTGETKVVFCPSDRYLDQNTAQCIPYGYTSCASVGFPNNFCSSGSVCTADGKCQSTSGVGNNVNENFGKPCVSAANSCGMLGQALYTANGECPARPPLDSQCPPPVVTGFAVPAHIRSDTECTINWSVEHATACTLSSNGVDSGLPKSATLPTGSYVSPPISSERIYTLSCQNGAIVRGSGNIICRITPNYIEQ